MSKHGWSNKIDDQYDHRDRFSRPRGISLEQLDAIAEKAFNQLTRGGYSRAHHKICPSCYIAMKRDSDQCDYCDQEHQIGSMDQVIMKEVNQVNLEDYDEDHEYYCSISFRDVVGKIAEAAIEGKTIMTMGDGVEVVAIADEEDVIYYIVER